MVFIIGIPLLLLVIFGGVVATEVINRSLKE